MKLLFKQRLFSWLDSYDIYDEEGSTVFTVEGKLSFGHCLQIYNPNGDHIGTLKEEVLSFLPKFRMYVGEQYIGEIAKEFSFLKPKFSLECNDWKVEGDFWEWDYFVTDSRNDIIMTASKELMHLTDTYQIHIPKQENMLYALMIVLAIDAARCSSNS